MVILGLSGIERVGDCGEILALTSEGTIPIHQPTPVEAQPSSVGRSNSRSRYRRDACRDFWKFCLVLSRFRLPPSGHQTLVYDGDTKEGPESRGMLGEDTMRIRVGSIVDVIGTGAWWLDGITFS